MSSTLAMASQHAVKKLDEMGLDKDEYVPPASPPQIDTSESMRRLRDLLVAGKVSTASRLTFTFNQVVFSASILESGALSARAPRQTDRGAVTLADGVFKVYDSPSEFAADMMAVALGGKRRRGVNGWEECFVRGRSLASLRNEMLREKKPTGGAERQGVVGGDAKKNDAGGGDVQQGAEEGKHAQGEVGTDDARKAALGDGEKGSAVVVDLTGERPEGKEDAVGVEKVVKGAKGDGRKEEDSGKQRGDGNGTVDGERKEPEPVQKALQESERPAIATPERKDKDGQVVEEPEPHVADKEKSDPVKTVDDKDQQSSDAVDAPADRASPEPEIIEEKSRGEKRKQESPPKQETKRRKRNESNDSSPSEANTPSRRSQERASKPRSEWTRSGRKHDIPSAAEMDTEGLDPDTIEAAAIAFQAEKEEANSRARRTTRLATGKIKHVDYKASANAQGPRSVSPANDEEDTDANFASNDSAMENTRASRRRAAQVQPQPPQRSSRRVAKLRSSQEKDQSSNDDINTFGGRNSSSGNGSDGRNDSPGARNDEQETDSLPGGRMNGTRGEGRERKRARLDSTSRRTRQSNTDSGDVDGEGKSYYGTRSSTRENSVEKDENADETSNDDDVDMEDDEDPEKRTDEFGWNFHDLTRIGDAMDMQDSMELDRINRELRDSGNWSVNDENNKKIAAFIKSAQASISELKKSVLADSKSEASVSDLRAYLANKVWRLKHGGIKTSFPRKPTAILAKTEKEEQEKLNAERQRRKLQREADEQRDKLDSEMDTRRKAELELLYAEILKSDVADDIDREIFRRNRLQEDIDRYKVKETKARARLDKTKLLVNQLRGEKEIPDDATAAFQNQATNSQAERKENTENGERSEAQATRESVTSEDDVDVVMKDEASSEQMRREMDRLRDLIAAKESESERFHRACERERLHYVTLLDAKKRLEAELYLSKSSGYAAAAAAAPNPPASSSKKAAPDPSRKPETAGRNGGPHGHRNPGGSRAKGGNGKNGGPSSSVVAPKNGAPNKSKQASGKNGESSKAVKRKSSSKAQANGTEK